MMKSIMLNILYGHDFINYRREIDIADRKIYSNNIRKIGNGYVPIVIDSIDITLINVLNSYGYDFY